LYVLVVQLPAIVSMSELSLSVSSGSVELEAVDCSVYAPLELTLPAAVDESAGRAKFDRKARALTLRLPLLQTSVVSEAEGELV